jgi:hypothetical protein
MQMKAISLLAIFLLSACDSATGLRESPGRDMTSTGTKWHWDALRVKVDSTRNRRWVLDLKFVDVYDKRTDNLIKRIDLPPWTVADFVCPPDIAFDRTGTAYISHNVEPKLWQIDPDTFLLKEHRLRLLQRESLDIGLTKLRFSADGTLFAGASLGGLQWRIDLESATGQPVDVLGSVMDECGFREA